MPGFDLYQGHILYQTLFSGLSQHIIKLLGYLTGKFVFEVFLSYYTVQKNYISSKQEK
jgi:hypothetical protein